MPQPIRVLVVTSEWPSPDDPYRVPFLVQRVEFLRRAGLGVDVFSFRGARRLSNYIGARRRLRALLRASPGRYDIVHAEFAQSALLAFPRALPLVIGFRGGDILDLRADDGRRTPLGISLARVCRAMACRADAVVVVSEHMRALLPAGLPLHVVPSGLDFGALPLLDRDEARQRLGLPHSERLVLFAADPNEPVKRYALARRTVDLVDERLPARLVVAWRVAHSDIPLYMNACDAYLMTSLSEGSPNVVKEALACDLPVVSVPVGDVPARIGGVPGCELCPDDSPASLAAALDRVLRRGTRIAGRATVRDLDETTLAARIADIYRAVLERRRAAR